MPYIPSKDRPILDPLINELADKIVEIHKSYAYSDGAFAGMINYSCTRLATQVATKSFGRIRYWIVAILFGVFHTIAEEFYHRVATPYDSVQCQKYGDIDTYQEMIKGIK